MMTSYRVFNHATADKAELYRAVMRTFVQARESFRLHLRVADLQEALGGDDPTPALTQLREWGNLEAFPDTSEVSTVEEFYRPRFLYQMTPTGEAAERALQLFESSLQQPGELQAAALGDIRTLLVELNDLARPPIDSGRTYLAFRALRERFDELTSRAQTFLAGLQRSFDLHGVPGESIIRYKQLLIDYLERFVGELVVSTAAIVTEIERLHSDGIDRLLAACVEREVADALDADTARHAAAHQWERRWAGLRAWFVRIDERPSQAEFLRARTRSAIPALLNAIRLLHDRRVTRTDRWTDLRTLARWFMECDDDRDAHRLWRGAFGLHSTRHLFIDTTTIARRDEERGQPPSWLTAPPIEIPLRLRQTGHHTRRGRVLSVTDRSDQKALLDRLVDADESLIREARRRIVAGRRVRLSEVGNLNDPELDLLLELLGEAFAARVDADEPVDIVSMDGSTRIVVEPTGDGATATVSANRGTLRGNDVYLLVEDLLPRGLTP